MAKDEDVIEVGRDVEREYPQDEKPDLSGGAEEVVGMQELDPALDRKMHLVNNVSRVTQRCSSCTKANWNRHWIRLAGPTITSSSSSSTALGELQNISSSHILQLLTFLSP